MMESEHQFHLQMILHNFYDLNLSAEQAELIVQHERIKNFPLENQYFSKWEEWDFERSAFKNILSAEQYIIYETNLEARISQYENDLLTDDAERIPNEIEYHQATYNFYVEKFLPDFFKRPLHVLLYGFYQEKSKIDFLKAEYKKYIDANKKDILISHFRENRLFMPNQLRLIVLRHKLSGCGPNYSLFKHRMDEPTRAIASYLKNKISINGKSAEEFLEQKELEATAFNKANFEKYRNPNYGFVTWGKPVPEEEQEIRLMSLLLLDEERYGC